MYTHTACNRRILNGLSSFHVVVPSLPGFFISTLPKREDWQLDDAALTVNYLMVDVLGYDRYAMQGGDFVSDIHFFRKSWAIQRTHRMKHNRDPSSCALQAVSSQSTHLSHCLTCLK